MICDLRILAIQCLSVLQRQGISAKPNRTSMMCAPKQNVKTLLCVLGLNYSDFCTIIHSSNTWHHQSKKFVYLSERIGAGARTVYTFGVDLGPYLSGLNVWSCIPSKYGKFVLGTQKLSELPGVIPTPGGTSEAI